MDCEKTCCTNIKIPIYTIIYNKRKNFKSYFIFIGNNNKIYSKLFDKIELKQKILKSELELLKKNFIDYYKIWITLLKNKNINIKFIYNLLNKDDNIYSS